MAEGPVGPRSGDGWEPLDDEQPAGKTRFMVSLGREQLAELREHAEHTRLPIAELVRRAVDDYLASLRD